MHLQLEKPLIDTLPEPTAVRVRLGDVLREAELLRKLLRLAKAAAAYRELDRASIRRESGATYAR